MQTMLADHPSNDGAHHERQGPETAGDDIPGASKSTSKIIVNQHVPHTGTVSAAAFAAMILDEVLVDRLAAGETLVDSMPVVDVVLIHPPAEIDFFPTK